MLTAIKAFFMGLGILGIIGYWAIVFGAFIGYVLNAIGLVKHLPTMDIELLVRLIGLVIYPIGALLGWFL